MTLSGESESGAVSIARERTQAYLDRLSDSAWEGMWRAVQVEAGKQGAVLLDHEAGYVAAALLEELIRWGHLE